ncbi:polysaccharide deacetylase family protein [Clostridium malenominatum]|uniref:Polysaccharide deacetylase family protein n=1 Tax=Clostridium malenominatum TaxID=1539 RepID=A0ABP3U8F9_9CLOT
MKKRLYFLIFIFILSLILKTGISQVKAANNNKEKVVFLTFDDGPSPNNTPKILKILKENGVKASFFVIGALGENNPQIIKKMYSEGMTILPHTYSHDYKAMYSSVDNYFQDLDKCIKVINNLTGKDYYTYTRLPGGSDNQVSNGEILRTIRNKLNAKGVDYIDWNVSSGDAEGETVAVNVLNHNIKNGCNNTNLAVILMHDSYYKSTTVESLDSIIKDLKAKGYTFKTLEEMTNSERRTMIRMGIVNRR